MAKHILIIGASGFAGSHLTEYLLTHTTGEAQIFGTYHQPAELEKYQQLFPTVIWKRLDVTDAGAVVQLVQEILPSEIYNLSGIANVAAGNASVMQRVNCDGAVHILAAAQQCVPQARIVLVSSAYVYGNCSLQNPAVETDPLSGVGLYAESKIAMEQAAQQYPSLQVMIARPFNHIGARQPVGFITADVAKQIVALEAHGGGTVQVGALNSYRDFLDVRDVVAAYVRIMEQGEPGNIYNICAGQSYPIATVVQQLVRLAKVPLTLKESASTIPAKVPVLAGSAAKLAALGWKPQYTLTDALGAVLEYWRTCKE